MTGRERIISIINRKNPDRSGFWIGNPTAPALELYCGRFGVGDLLGLSAYAGDDLIWINAERILYDHPKEVFQFTKPGTDIPFFYDTEDALDVERAYWPDPGKLDFTRIKDKLVRARATGKAVFSGMWSGFWHHFHSVFGFENCFIKMYTAPAVVEAAGERFAEYYLECNRRIFTEHRDKIDACFIGNDMGTQNDCMISPEMYRRFVFPYLKRLVAQAKSFGLPLALHSCGSIDRIIPDLIGMGVDILHPIQARARGMEAETLQREYGGEIIFMGGLDTQDILPFKSPGEVYAEVMRLRGIFGKYYIMSPSHEALLNNVPPENFDAMCRAAVK